MWLLIFFLINFLKSFFFLNKKERCHCSLQLVILLTGTNSLTTIVDKHQTDTHFHNGALIRCRAVSEWYSLWQFPRLLSLANNETLAENWEITFGNCIEIVTFLSQLFLEWQNMWRQNAMITILRAADTKCVFLSLLTGLCYYAGHGYEHAGRNYLVAVDAPQPYRPENCVCVQRVMLSMQRRHTALSVILLDTCRKW